MATSAHVAIKRSTEIRTAWPPTTAVHDGTLFLSSVERRTGTVRVSSSDDFDTFGEAVEVGGRSRTASAIAAGPSGLVVAWVDWDSGRILLSRSVDGAEWSEPIVSEVRADGPIRLAVHDERIWLARVDPRGGEFDVFSSADGPEWRTEHTGRSDGPIPPTLVVVDDQMTVAWADHRRGVVQLTPVGSTESRSSVLYDDMIPEPILFDLDGTLHLAWSDDDTDEIRLLARTERGWRELASLHERTEGAPSLFAAESGMGLAWIHADGSGTVRLRPPTGDAIIEPSHVFHGDVQGHPTALSSNHHTPYPYLGIVVLPNDWSLPKGTTQAGLVSDLDSTLDEVADFWEEASFGAVEIAHDVHPSVVTLPSPMSTYLVRARPKLIDGYGAAYPVAFTGAKTLDLVAEGNFSVTVTFPSSPLGLSIDAAITEINDTIAAANYAGPEASKPVATKNELDQIRLQTVDKVDAGDTLAITGGSALALLGLDSANRTVYEGSTTQTDHLESMLRDALAAVAKTKPNPAAFLAGYYGCVISIASNVDWYVLRANATLGPKDVAILPGENDFKLAFYYVTSMTRDDTHAHEVGHNLDLPDQYEEGARNVGTEPGNWDCMDNNSFSHPSAWVKSYRSSRFVPASRWVDASRVATVDSATQSVEVLLAPLESKYPATNPFAQTHPGVPLRHAVRVDLSPGHAYYVENRQHGDYDDVNLGKVNYSRHLPGDGIIITDAVDDPSSLSISRVPTVMVHPRGFDVPKVPETAIDQVMAAATVAAKQAIIDAYVPAVVPQSVADRVARTTKRQDIEWILRSHREGEIRAFYPVDTLGEDVLVHEFPDGSQIRVKLLEVIGTARPFVYSVRVSWGQPGSWFDLETRRWQNPPPYESDDIWIDSEENGWGVYEHSDAAANPGVPGNPVLNGDRPWVGHDNRVMARVWNHGDIAQNNVRVDFAEVVPPGQSGGYTFDTDYVNIPAGGSAIATGIWRPKKVPANEHGCVAAQVEYRDWDLSAQVIGERNQNNNTAQENIGDFYVSASSPYESIELPFEFASPLPDPCEMSFRAHGLEPGWSLRVEPYRFRLQPGESMQGRVLLEAEDTVPLEDPEEGSPAPTISLEAMVRIGCTWEPIGGFSMIAHTVRRSEMDVTVDPAGGGTHVGVEARDTVGPIARANVAVALVLGDERVVSVTRFETDADGRAHGFVPIDWGQFAQGAPLSLDVRLSPKGQSGPSAVAVPVAHP